ncbi:hypothetical protein MMC21_007652 [Puttea exsequens]|nr:hypothetical protein [Puttea exsequens]
MDPLSITASVIAIIDLAGQIIKFGKDVADAPKVIRDLTSKVESLKPVFEMLVEYCRKLPPAKAGETPAKLRSLYEVRRIGKDEHGKDRVERHGPVARLEQLLSDVVAMLMPTNSFKKTEIYQHLIIGMKKGDFQDIFTDVDTCMTSINIVFNLDLHEGQRGLQEGQRDLQVALSKMSVDEATREARRLRLEEDAERAKICQWLSPLSFFEKREELWENSFHNVGNWLWQDKCFVAWKSKLRPWYLELVGGIGTGKTVLSSVIAHHLSSEFPADEIPVMSIYLDYKSSSTQTLPHLVGCLLKQLVQMRQSLDEFKDLRDQYMMAVNLELKVDSCLEKVYALLKQELDRYERFFLLVDGLDELAPSEANALLGKVLGLTKGKGSLMVSRRLNPKRDDRAILYECTRCQRTQNPLIYRCAVCDKGKYDLCYVCVEEGHWCRDTSRSHTLKEPYSSRFVEIPATDIEAFVRWRLDIELQVAGILFSDEEDVIATENLLTTPFQDMCIGKDNQHDGPALQKRIVAEVTAKADGRFLFAKLYMDSLSAVRSLRMLERTMRTFPSDLDGVYTAALERIQKQSSREDGQLAYRALGILKFARRTLTVGELQHTLAVADPTFEEDDDRQDIVKSLVTPKTILGCTLSLVTSAGGHYRLVHGTLEDFFRKELNSKKWIPDAQAEMARACMIYLNIVLPKNSCDNDQLVAESKQFPFLGYASQYWGDHVRSVDETDKEVSSIQKMALHLLSDAQLKDTYMQAAWATDSGGHGTWDVWRDVDKLHICAWFGLTALLAQMDPASGMVDKTEPKYGQTPLMYACRKGHADTARALLALGASQSRVSSRGRNALLEAILAPDATSSGDESSLDISKHSQVIEMLVCEAPGDLDINYRHEQELQQTALMHTARLGFHGAAKILLRHPGINVDLQDMLGRTALYLAIKENGIKIARLLLEFEADTSILDFHTGASPLSVAAQRGYCQIIRILLESGADLDLKDREGRTALLRAVNRGEIDAVRELMDHSVDLESIDNNGQTLLHGAAIKGYTDIARLLLEGRPPKLKCICPNVRDRYGMTPLHWAARYNFASTASLLLKFRADATLVDEIKRIPSLVAWQYGSRDVLDIIVNAEKAQQHRTTVHYDEDARPAWSLARQGLTGAIDRAISTRPEDFSILEPCTDNSPIHCAVENDHIEALYSLLACRKIAINGVNNIGRTPLHMAALSGNHRASNALIDYGVDIEARDRWDDEALFLAELNGYRHIMLLLIDSGAKMDKTKIDWKELFFFAVEQGNDSVVKTMIDKHGVDRSVQNKDGLRAIQIATSRQDQDMMKVLNVAPTVSIHGSDMSIGEEGDLDPRLMKFVPFRSRPLEISEDEEDEQIT